MNKGSGKHARKVRRIITPRGRELQRVTDGLHGDTGGVVGCVSGCVEAGMQSDHIGGRSDLALVSWVEGDNAVASSQRLDAVQSEGLYQCFRRTGGHFVAGGLGERT